MGRPLPYSRDTDVATNREARMTGRQMAGLWYAGLWRALVGLPLAGIAAALVWQVPILDVAFLNFVLMVAALLFVGVGAYLSFRAFSFLGDAITRNVSYVTGRVGDDITTSRGRSSYFMTVGPVRKQLWRKRTWEALPLGALCHVYYASGSLNLLSLEPATAAEPHPSLRFGGDPIHAWDRLRWSWLIPAVAVFGLAAGAHAMISAHPAHTVMVSGRISEYHEYHRRSATTRYLHLQGSSDEYTVSSLTSLSPPLPALDNYIGDQIDVYINSDMPGDVLAIRLRGTLYADDLYLHPEHQYWGMIWSGAPIALLSGAVLALFVWATTWLRKHPTANQTGLPPFPSS